MTKINLTLLLSFSLFMNSAYAGRGSAPHPQPDLVFDAEQVNHDLEEMLTTKEEIKSKMQIENRSLLMNALNYNAFEMLIAVGAAAVIAFVVAKDPLKLGPLYWTNGKRLIQGLRMGKRLKEIEYIEDSTFISTTGVALGAVASIGFISSNLWIKGVCIFSCLDAVASRVTDRQEQEFLMSPTFKKIESEIGERSALQFVSIMKAIRANSYTNEDPYKLMAHFVEGVSQQKLKSFDDLNLTAAPTFTAVVRSLNGAWLLNALVFSYLNATDQIKST